MNGAKHNLIKDKINMANSDLTLKKQLTGIGAQLQSSDNLTTYGKAIQSQLQPGAPLAIFQIYSLDINAPVYITGSYSQVIECIKRNTAFSLYLQYKSNIAQLYDYHIINTDTIVYSFILPVDNNKNIAITIEITAGVGKIIDPENPSIYKYEDVIKLPDIYDAEWNVIYTIIDYNDPKLYKTQWVKYLDKDYIYTWRQLGQDMSMYSTSSEMFSILQNYVLLDSLSELMSAYITDSDSVNTALADTIANYLTDTSNTVYTALETAVSTLLTDSESVIDSLDKTLADNLINNSESETYNAIETHLSDNGYVTDTDVNDAMTYIEDIEDKIDAIWNEVFTDSDSYSSED